MYCFCRDMRGVSAHPSNVALHLSSRTGSPPVAIPAQGDHAGVRTVGSQWQAKDGGRNKLWEIAFPKQCWGLERPEAKVEGGAMVTKLCQQPEGLPDPGTLTSASQLKGPLVFTSLATELFLPWSFAGLFPA